MKINRSKRQPIKASYSPELLDSLIEQYSGQYNYDTHESIWEAIYEQYKDAGLADDVLAALEDQDDDEYFDEEYYDGFAEDLFGASEKEKYDKLAWGSDDELANYVRDLTNGDYIVEDTGGGDVTLKKKTADGNYEVVGEENDINKSDLFSTYLMSYLQNSGEYAKLTEAEREAKIKEAEAAKAELVSFGVDSSLITSALSDWADDKTISADTLVNLTRAEVEKLKQQAQSSNSAIG